MFSIRTVVTVLFVAAAFILPSIGTASASPGFTTAGTGPSAGDAMTPDDTPWN